MSHDCSFAMAFEVPARLLEQAEQAREAVLNRIEAEHVRRATVCVPIQFFQNGSGDRESRLRGRLNTLRLNVDPFTVRARSFAHRQRCALVVELEGADEPVRRIQREMTRFCSRESFPQFPAYCPLLNFSYAQACGEALIAAADVQLSNEPHEVTNLLLLRNDKAGDWETCYRASLEKGLALADA